MVKVIQVCALVMLALANNSAFAFRCGHDLITEGDHKIEVRAACGEPDDITRMRGYRYYNEFYYRFDRERRTYSSVDVELWTYNMGPFKFMRRLRFENGILADIETLGRGFRER